jgi:hypothetical protein
MFSRFPEFSDHKIEIKANRASLTPFIHLSPNGTTNNNPESEGKFQRSVSSISRAIDQRALLNPRHHFAQFGADRLGRMRRELGAHRLE